MSVNNISFNTINNELRKRRYTGTSEALSLYMAKSTSAKIRGENVLDLMHALSRDTLRDLRKFKFKRFLKSSLIYNEVLGYIPTFNLWRLQEYLIESLPNFNPVKKYINLFAEKIKRNLIARLDLLFSAVKEIFPKCKEISISNNKNQKISINTNGSGKIEFSDKETDFYYRYFKNSGNYEYDENETSHA